MYIILDQLWKYNSVMGRLENKIFDLKDIFNNWTFEDSAEGIFCIRNSYGQLYDGDTKFTEDLLSYVSHLSIGQIGYLWNLGIWIVEYYIIFAFFSAPEKPASSKIFFLYWPVGNLVS